MDNTNRLTCSQAKQKDIVNYLAELGHSPTKQNGNDYWYCSPLRTEKTASFKVCRKLNCWYDHGTGKGGNLIDFGILYVLRIGKSGNVFGITYVDHSKKTVFNGSDLGKIYSAKAIVEKCNVSSPKTADQIHDLKPSQQLHNEPMQKTKDTPSQQPLQFVLENNPVPQPDYVPFQLRKRKRKKRKRLSL